MKVIDPRPKQKIFILFEMPCQSVNTEDVADSIILATFDQEKAHQKYMERYAFFQQQPVYEDLSYELFMEMVKMHPDIAADHDQFKEHVHLVEQELDR